MVLGIGYTLRIRKRSSCLHKDSYMAQRKERTLGYEGRYRRTLSPSGLGTNNNNSKSSLEASSSLGASDSMGGARITGANLPTEKLDSTLSPSAWEKFHNIRPPSTTVIFTSNELAKASGSSPSPSSASSTSSSPQPPVSQPLFHRSISCDNNIFNNKTGASQSSIPPPVAQVAPLRGSSTSSSGNNAVEHSLEKISQLSLRNDVIPFSTSNSPDNANSDSVHSSKSCDNHGTSPSQLQPLSRDNNGSINSNGTLSSNCDGNDKPYRDSLCQRYERKEFDDLKEQNGSRILPNSTLPSVIVPPLQYEKYEKDSRGSGLSLNSHYSAEGNSSSTILKKSEVNLRVNCDVDLENGENQNGIGGKDGKGPSSKYLQCDSMSAAATSSSSSNSDGFLNSKGYSNASSSVTASNSTVSFYTGRQKTQEELECEELSRDIAKQLPQGDKLQTLLVPLPDHKTTADYMEGLFHLELKLQPEAMERRGSQSLSTAAGGSDKCAADLVREPDSPDNSRSNSQTSCGNSKETSSQNQKTGIPKDPEASLKSGGFSPNPEKCEMYARSNGSNGLEHHERTQPSPNSLSEQTVPAESAVPNSDDKSQPINSMSTSYRRCNGHAPLPADSAYFTTSESKAKFLTQYNNDIKKEAINGTDSEELDKQKEELVSRISRKLEILRTEQLDLREEIQSNEQLGQMVVERVKQTAKRNEFDKFKLHVEEIEKITSLLLGISGRLARAENALMGLSDPPNPQEKKILESKRDKLREQLDEAKVLKENIDRRSAQVSTFLQKYLTAEEYADYDHFVKMKAKLIIDAREIDDKIKLGEEQLGALKDALNTSLPLSPNISSS